MDDGKIVRLVSDSARTEDGISTWLRAMADQVDSGELGDVQGAVLVFTVSHGDNFSCKLRRTKMSFLETLGALRTIMHDMLHS
jgi:hypothetical protein